jgi:hypothetical protein
MKNTRLLLVFSAMSVFFMGCPYSSEMPIEDPSVKIDIKLLGKWQDKKSEDYDYTITKSTESIYKISKKKVKGDNAAADTSSYMAYISEINGSKFLNLWDANSSPRSYYFYKMELSGSGARVTLSPVTDNIEEKFTNPGELKKFIQTHMNLSFFYDKEKDIYLRAD